VDYILEEHLDSWDGLEHRAVKAVFTANSEYAVQRLAGLLEDSLSPGELGNVIQWLGETGGEEARQVLESMLTDSLSTGLTITLIRTLGEIGNMESLPLIEPFAGDAGERVRRQTAVSLGEFGEQALPALETLVNDPSLAVRSAARASIDGIEGSEQGYQ